MRLKSTHSFMLLAVLILAVALCRAAPDEPADQSLPTIVLAGLDAYKANGPEAGLKTWLKGTGLDEEKQALSQAQLFKQIETYYGSYKSYELIRTTSISKSVKMVFLVMKFQRGPVFVGLTCYKPESDWLATGIGFNMNAQQVLPASLLSDGK